MEKNIKLLPIPPPQYYKIEEKKVPFASKAKINIFFLNRVAMKAPAIQHGSDGSGTQKLGFGFWKCLEFN